MIFESKETLELEEDGMFIGRERKGLLVGAQV